ncbi:molybdate ABC transporter substrate-binding protein [Marinicella sp. W31]|uniref:molybdate ABC transporter substrate-binding protein n=1 Tax=Marinicella sp. W31 TaxID=3023713 RepID=UPI00375809D5
MKILYVFLIPLVFLACADKKEHITVAVASNFKSTLEVIAERYHQQYNTEVTIVSASSGQLLAQIRQGAPYDVFLSADTAKVDALIADGLGESEARVYALGQLALWINKSDIENTECWKYLKQVNQIAVANPRTAPYGIVADDYLHNLDYDGLERITAPNVALAFGLVYQEQVEAGLVAYAHIKAHNIDSGCIQRLPVNNELRQSMIVLKPSGKLFFEFMQQPEIQSLIIQAGYVDQRDAL